MSSAFDFPPDAVLITAPVGSGKTEAAINEIVQAREFSAFGTIWVLLATGQQIYAFQQRLLARSPDSVQFGVEFFNFEGLYLHLLDLLGDPPRLLGDTARTQVLRHVIARLQPDLELFGEIAETPGFVALAADLIHELKQGLVQPDGFDRVAAPRGPKDRDLARIYAAYQRFLQDHALADRHGAGWMAVHHLERGDRLPQPVDLLVVDGFDQFNQVHVRLLDALTRQVKRTVLTLTAVPEEPGRNFRRFEQTRDRLSGVSSGAARTDAARKDAARPGTPDRPQWRLSPPLHHVERGPGGEVLDHLSRYLFHTRPALIPGDDSLALIEAPDVNREVSAVLRRVKRRLLDGTPPESIAVVTRDMARYSTALRETARAYGIPLVVREGLALRENPAVAQVLQLIDLAELDFPRRDVLDTLHSPYLTPPDFAPGQVAHLERISLERQVVQGEEIWLEEVGAAGYSRTDEDGEERTLLAHEEAGALGGALASFFVRITPPPSGTVYEFVRWIEALIGPDPEAAASDAAETGGPEEADGSVSQAPDAPDHFNLLGNLRDSADAGRVTRDLMALHDFRRILAGICAAHDLVTAGEPAVLDWRDFRAELQMAVDRQQVTPPGGLSRLGRVLATNVFEVRGLPHDHVYVLGLSEGIFPALETENALYQERERIALARKGIDLQSAAEQDDMSLFYQVIGLARRSLTLSRFTVDDQGALCPPSPYWHAVRAVVQIPDGAILHLKTGSAPTLDEAATPGEAAVALAAVLSAAFKPLPASDTVGEPHPPAPSPTELERESGSDGVPLSHLFYGRGVRGEGEEPGISASEGALPAAGVYNALLDRWGDRWRAVLRGRAIEARREDPAQPFDRYTGLLADPALVDEAARQLGPDRVWSASQFNEYGQCPFRFFAKRLLRLEELEEPQEGLDQLQLGLVNHAILEQTYRRIMDEDLAITPENQDRALDILHEVAASVLDDAPWVFRFRASPLWEHEQAEMRRRLEWLVRQDFSDEAPFRLHAGEKPDDHPVADRIGDLDRHPYAQEIGFGKPHQLPLALDGPAGTLRAQGVIDRIDRAGGHLVLIDYKSGAAKHPVEDMAAGRDVQMILYLLAARELIRRDPRLQVTGGFFWHIRNRTVSGEILSEHPAVEEAQAQIHAHVLAARAGAFPVHPGRPGAAPCASYCEFRQLCRLTRANLRKP